MVKPRKENYDLNTVKGKTNYTVDMLEYRKFIREKRAERDANCVIADGLKTTYKRMNNSRRKMSQW